MPMRTECRHYESRTYANGEAVRKCDLDLAPEAPWRCPETCPKYERRTDIAWSWGTAIAPPTPAEPDAEGIAELLDEAEEIINAIGPQVLAEVQAEHARVQARDAGWRRIFKRGKR
jgi:hypothetical protein